MEDIERQRKNYSSVYYNGQYICAMDRGVIPEFKNWELVDGVQPISMADIDKYEDTKVSYIQILPTDPFFNAALTKAQRKDDNYEIRDGKVFRYEAFRFCKVAGRVINLGWRHTLEALIRSGIPGVTRDSLSAKFGINMHMVPTGQLEDIQRALYEE